MEDKTSEKIKEKIYQDFMELMSQLSIYEAVELLSNIMLNLSFRNYDKTMPSISNWDEAFLAIKERSKTEQESIFLAIGKQALTMNMWVQNMKNN